MKNKPTCLFYSKSWLISCSFQPIFECCLQVISSDLLQEPSVPLSATCWIKNKRGDRERRDSSIHWWLKDTHNRPTDYTNLWGGWWVGHSLQLLYTIWESFIGWSWLSSWLKGTHAFKTDLKISTTKIKYQTKFGMSDRKHGSCIIIGNWLVLGYTICPSSSN